jgi:hypothetical protein
MLHVCLRVYKRLPAAGTIPVSVPNWLCLCPNKQTAIPNLQAFLKKNS